MKKRTSGWRWLLVPAVLGAVMFASCNIDGSGSIDTALGESPIQGTWTDGADDLTFGGNGKVTGTGVFATAIGTASITWSAAPAATPFDVQGRPQYTLTIVQTPASKSSPVARAASTVTFTPAQKSVVNQPAQIDFAAAITALGITAGDDLDKK